MSDFDYGPDSYTEAEYLGDIYDGTEEGEFDDDYAYFRAKQRRIDMLRNIAGINHNSKKRNEHRRCSRSVEEDAELYKINKDTKVGTEIKCAGPLCTKKFIKKSYQQAFCCTKCKDQFWNRRQFKYGDKKLK